MRHLCGLIIAAVALGGCAGTASSSFSNTRPPQVGTAPVGGIGGVHKHTTTATTPPTTTTSTSAAAGTCTNVPAPTPKGPQHFKAPTNKLDPAKTYTVTVVTNCGTFAFTLDVKDQPKTAASVYDLAKRGFYDGLIFHRVVAGFVIQGGDPLGNGEGGPGYTVVEAPPANATYPEGTVAMAKTGAEPSGASGSQFFVMSGTQGLPPQYAIAGKVVSGLSTVLRIGALPTNPAEMPTPTVVMSSVTVKVT
jgi:cyclophilin family peptidyl-prolyl cis-trans isomerase